MNFITAERDEHKALETSQKGISMRIAKSAVIALATFSIFASAARAELSDQERTAWTLALGKDADYQQSTSPEIEIIGTIHFEAWSNYIVVGHPSLWVGNEARVLEALARIQPGDARARSGTRVLMKGKIVEDATYPGHRKFAVGWVRKVDDHDADWEAPWPMNFVLLPSDEVRSIPLIAACQASGPAQSELGFNAVQFAHQRFKLLEIFHGEGKIGESMELEYSYLVPGMVPGWPGRDIRPDEKVIWVVTNTTDGKVGYGAVADTPGNRKAAQRLAERLKAARADLSDQERTALRDYAKSPASVKEAAQICLRHKLTKGQILDYLGDTYRVVAMGGRMEFYYAPSQVLTMYFDKDGIVQRASDAGFDISVESQTAPAEKGAIDVSLVTSEDFAAIVIHPRRIVQSLAASKQLKDEISAGAIETLGIDPSDVEQIVMLFSFEEARPLSHEPVPVTTIRFTHDVDAREVLTKMQAAMQRAKKPGPIQEVRFGGRTCLDLGPEAGLAYVPRKNTIVLAAKVKMKKVLAVDKPRGPLWERLTKADSGNDIVMATAMESFPDFDGCIDQTNFGITFMDLGALKKARGGTATFNLTAPSIVRMVLDTKDPEAAGKVKGLLQELPRRALFLANRGITEKDLAKLGPFLKLAAECVDGATTMTSGSQVVLEVKRPASLDTAGPTIVRQYVKGEFQIFLDALR